MAKNHSAISKKWRKEGYKFYDNYHPFKCKHCNKNFKDYTYIKQHTSREMKRLVEKYKQNILHRLQHKRDANDPFVLQLAKKELVKDADYQLLIQTEKESKMIRPFICNICRKTFRDKETLKYHYFRVHNINNFKTEITLTQGSLKHISLILTH